MRKKTHLECLAVIQNRKKNHSLGFPKSFLICFTRKTQVVGFLPVLYCAPIQGSGFFLVAGFDDGFRGPFEKLVGRIESAPQNPLSGEE